jgi:hypothetical protein
MATYARGVTTSGVSTLGLVQNFEKGKEAESVTAEDENGEVAFEEKFNHKHNVTFEVVYDTTQTLPDVGDTLSVGSVNYICDTVTEMEENKGLKRVKITAHRWIGNSLPAA